MRKNTVLIKEIVNRSDNLKRIFSLHNSINAATNQNSTMIVQYDAHIFYKKERNGALKS